MLMVFEKLKKFALNAIAFLYHCVYKKRAYIHTIFSSEIVLFRSLRHQRTNKQKATINTSQRLSISCGSN